MTITLPQTTLAEAVAAYPHALTELPNEGRAMDYSLAAYDVGNGKTYPAQRFTQSRVFSYVVDGRTWQAAFIFDILNNRWSLGAD